MPIISMFYGIIIRLYLIDNKHHNLPHIHAKYAAFEALSVSAMARYLPVNYRANNYGWFRHGLNFTAMS